jgi:hypothetical protein
MKTRLALLLLTLGLLPAGTALALNRPGVLGSEGELYSVRTGIYKDLFPGSNQGGNETDAGNAVLALEVNRPGKAAERLLVPDTAGPEVESVPFVLFEESSKSIVLVWRSEVKAFHETLNLSSYQDGKWSAKIEVTVNPFAAKTAPQVAITGDEYTARNAEGNPETVKRTILHLIWWEEGKILYAPLTLLNGVYTGSHPLFDVTAFDTQAPGPAAAAAVEIASELLRSPRIQSGRNDHSVVISFVNPRNGLLTSVETTVLPGELSVLADGARAHIIESGAKHSGDLKRVADEARAHIIESGVKFHPKVLSLLADEARAHIIESGVRFGSDFKGLAQSVGSQLVETGSIILENAQTVDASEAPQAPHILDMDSGFEALLQMRILSGRPAPETGPVPTTIYASEDGQRVLVAWESGDEVLYREWREDSWSSVMGLHLTSSLTRERVEQILEQRVRHR